MNLLNKIYISNITYIILLISLLAGYFEYIFLLLIFIIIHEFGHLIIASLLGFNIDKIIIYPFGGLTKFNIKISESILKEFIVAISGALFQILFYLFLKTIYSYNYISFITFEKIKIINTYLLLFNFLPIVPLDGGRIFNLLLYIFLPFKLSNKLITLFSIFLSILLVFLINNNLLVIMILLLLKNIYIEYKMIDFKNNKFLLERYLGDFYFKIKFINDIDKMYKNKVHKIKYEDIYINEKEYLSKKFDLKAHL
ncbi:MAG: M50 family metallopeptidase [Bacilli bacterium]|nr:M50 family metallopeptidase [Bacilli bacterium]